MVMVVVMVVAAVQDMLIIPVEVARLRILLQLMRLLGPVLSMLVVLVLVMVMMELHFLHLFLRPLPLDS